MKSTVPATLVLRPSVPNRVIARIPDSPAVRRRQLSDLPAPSDVTTPPPVTTTAGRPALSRMLPICSPDSLGAGSDQAALCRCPIRPFRPRLPDHGCDSKRIMVPAGHGSTKRPCGSVVRHLADTACPPCNTPVIFASSATFRPSECLIALRYAFRARCQNGMGDRSLVSAFLPFVYGASL